LRKSRSIFPDFIGRKDTHFSQMSQAFWQKSRFAKNISHPILSAITQNPQNEAFSEIAFFANDFAVF